jgi:hypothetical protein
MEVDARKTEVEAGAGKVKLDQAQILSAKRGKFMRFHKARALAEKKPKTNYG